MAIATAIITVGRQLGISDKGVKVVGTFPEDSHAPIVYPAAITAEAKSPDATAFMTFLSTETATKLFEAQGFTVLHAAAPAP